MTDKERELAEKYLDYVKAEMTARENAYDTKLMLARLAPHRIGEIIRWTETKTVRSGGTTWHPEYKDLPPKERMAVCVRVTAIVENYKELDVYYKYEFHPINKDGSVSKQGCYVRDGEYEWTGDVHESYKNFNHG